jgi:hypothetical protein
MSTKKGTRDQAYGTNDSDGLALLSLSVVGIGGRVKLLALQDETAGVSKKS